MAAHPRKFTPIRKSGKGYKVIARSTGKPLSRKPLPKARAQAQLRAIEFRKHNPGKK